jgi:hypothetical protein
VTRAGARRRVDCAKPRWVLPRPPIPEGYDGYYGDEVTIEVARATVEDWPITKSAGGDTSDDPREAAFEAKDVYWEDADSRATIRRLVKRIQNCREIDPATAEVDADTGQTLSFDGGHRLRAAMIAGLKTMPVAVEWTRNGETVGAPTPRPRIKP